MTMKALTILFAVFLLVASCAAGQKPDPVLSEPRLSFFGLGFQQLGERKMAGMNGTCARAGTDNYACFEGASNGPNNSAQAAYFRVLWRPAPAVAAFARVAGGVTTGSKDGSIGGSGTVAGGLAWRPPWLAKATGKNLSLWVASGTEKANTTRLVDQIRANGATVQVLRDFGAHLALYGGVVLGWGK